MHLATSHLCFGTIQLSTGPRVRFAAQGDPTGEPLVFLHGYTDSWYSFSQLLGALPHCYRAYALDQRGHGDSERPPDGYALDDFAADVVALLDALGVDRATLVGHCMGSFVARRVAEAWPERVARLVLLGSAPTPANAVILDLQPAVQTLADPVSPAFVREFQASTVYGAVPEAFFDRIVAESLKLPARVWRSALDGLLAADCVGPLGRIVAPTLIVGGEQDSVFSLQEQQRLADLLPGALLSLYAETGHSPHWERPERVAAELDGFLRAMQFAACS
jgi:non-heme chloroperoxidase